MTNLIDLRSADLEFTAVTLPEATSPIGLARLHADPGTGAAVSLVRFPAGWQRPATGHYTTAEEFVLLSGELVISGIHFVAGDCGFLPAFTSREATSSPRGCLALAWFAGTPRWVSGVTDSTTNPAPPADIIHSSPASQLRPRSAPGSARIGEPPTHATMPTEVLSLSTWQWIIVHPGQPVPALPAPMLVRTWL